MPKFDRSRPYGEVWGSVGLASYEQDGRQYRIDGQPIEPEPEAAPATPAAEHAASHKHGHKHSRKPGPTETPPAEPPDDELKTMVEIAGGVWTDRAAALAFLQAK